MTTLPMSYCSVEDMYKTLPEVGSISTVTSAILAHYGGRAEAEINARLSARYAVPFVSVPPIVAALAVDLAVYYTLGRKPLVGSQSKSDPWLDKFKEARDLLIEIAEGKVPLVDAGGTQIAASTVAAPFWSNNQNYLPTFTEQEPEEWTTDQDKLDDAANARD